MDYIEDRLERIEKTLEKNLELTQRLVENLEGRVRVLEEYVTKTKGVMSLLTWLGPAGVGALIIYLLGAAK